jgi:hypothetical protein
VIPADIHREDPWLLWWDDIEEPAVDEQEEAEEPARDGQEEAEEPARDEQEQVEAPSCSVCMAEYEENEALAMLVACGHHFHWNCINQWLEQSDTCPLCRGTIPEFGGIDVCNREQIGANIRGVENDAVAALRMIAAEAEEVEVVEVIQPRRRRRQRRRPRPY